MSAFPPDLTPSHQSCSLMEHPDERNSMETVTLASGAEIPKITVVTTFINLQELFRTRFIEFYKLVQLARNPGHQLFGQSGDVLRALGFLDGLGKLQGTVREIVLASTEGEDFDLRIVSPALAAREARA